MSNTITATIQTRGGDTRFEVAPTVGPLGAFRSSAAAQRCLDSYADCNGDDVVDARVDRMKDLDGRGYFYVALFEYSRNVKN